MRVRGLVVACVVVATSTFAVAAPALGATGIGLSASSHLHNGQTVTVTGTGFPVNSSIAITQCRTSAVSEVDCDLSRLVWASSSAVGNFTSTFPVGAHLSTAHGPVDCTAAPGTCSVAAALPSDIAATAATAAISFDPPDPTRRGVVVASPSSAYAWDNVQLHGSGWAPGATVTAYLCPAGATDTAGCEDQTTAFVDSDGTTTAYGWLRPVLSSATGPDVDCAVAPGCAMGLADNRDPDGTLAVVPVAVITPFDGTMTATPKTGLHGGDAVTLRGASWRPGDEVALYECTVDDELCTSLDPWPIAGDDGTFTMHVDVQQWLDGDHVCNWSTTRCELRWTNARSAVWPLPHSIALGFVTPPAPRAGTVDAPAEGQLGTALHADLHGWLGESFVRVAQCALGGATIVDRCTAPAEVATDAAGNSTADLWNITTTITTEDGTYPCTEAGDCAIVAWDPRDPAGSATSTPFTVPALVLGAVTVTPASALRGGDAVTIDGTGWTPNQTFVANECADTDRGWMCVLLGYGLVGTDGTFSMPSSVVATIGYPWPFDCAAVTGSCRVEVRLSADYTQERTAPLDFVADLQDITSHYSDSESATVQAAASELGLTPETYQRTAAWATMWVLGIARPPSLGTVAPDGGPNAITSSYPPFEAEFLQGVAAHYGVTPEQFQHHAALALAFVLGLS